MHLYNPLKAKRLAFIGPKFGLELCKKDCNIRLMAWRCLKPIYFIFFNSPEAKGPLLYIILEGICFINNSRVDYHLNGRLDLQGLCEKAKIEQMWPSLDHFYRDREERWLVRVCQSFVVGRTERGIFVAFYNHSFHQPDLYLIVLTFFWATKKAHRGYTYCQLFLTTILKCYLKIPMSLLPHFFRTKTAIKCVEQKQLLH